MGASRQHDAKVADLDHGISGYNIQEVADKNTEAGVYLVHTYDVPDAATANLDVVVVHAIRVVDVVVTKQAGAGGASDTITVSNAANPITDAMSINVADKTVVRPATIDDAYTDIAAGGTLRIVRTKASAANVACRVTIRCHRV